MLLWKQGVAIEKEGRPKALSLNSRNVSGTMQQSGVSGVVAMETQPVTVADEQLSHYL